jgi:hypothetical protein
MRPVWILALAASGCRGLLGIGDAVVIDLDAPPATSDAPAVADALDAPAACTAWQLAGLDACAFPPSAPLVLSGGAYTYDTRTAGGTLSGPTGDVLSSPYMIAPADGTPTAVLSIEALTISAGTTITVTGPKPLLVLAWSTLEIDGALDASSRRQAMQIGAGANEGCTTLSGAPGSDAAAAGSGGSGGGGGGGAQGAGAVGGDGGRIVVGGGAGGAAAAAAFRGGCPGGASGTAGHGATLPATSGSFALGGAGGGAVRMIAHDQITLGSAAIVSANGAAGAGAPLQSACGGGGGGAGGYLGFEAPVVMIDGTVTANGGAGGGGGGPTDLGHDGEDGAPSLIAARGGGGSATACGRPGGDGSDATSLDGHRGASFAPADCAATGGGGGGGGAAGFLVVASPAFTATASSTISPPVLRP